jgi:acetyl-CoA C-acetyltransferase
MFWPPASGLRMIYEVYKQIQGKAEKPERQLSDVRLELTHNIGGWPGAFPSLVTVLNKRE